MNAICASRMNMCHHSMDGNWYAPESESTLFTSASRFDYVHRLRGSSTINIDTKRHWDPQINSIIELQTCGEARSHTGGVSSGFLPFGGAKRAGFESNLFGQKQKKIQASETKESIN
eukprot:96535_1